MPRLVSTLAVVLAVGLVLLILNSIRSTTTTTTVRARLALPGNGNHATDGTFLLPTSVALQQSGDFQPMGPAAVAAAAAPEVPITYQSICESVEFAPNSPKLKVTIAVFAWRRLASLSRLLDSLLEAEYCGRVVPLKLFLDYGASDEVRDRIRSFRWPHGPRMLHEYDRSQGIRGLWINASSASIGDDEHIMPLEDDLELSPFFYWWLLRANRAYGSFDDGDLVQSRGIVGVSLYTPRLNEIQYPQVRWLPDRATNSPTFLLQVPCSWGALFLGRIWRQFLQFYWMRTAPPFYVFEQEKNQSGVGKTRQMLGHPALRLPRARSNVWPRSWKKFLIDFMYGRGYVMLYPNLRDQRAFSTTYMEKGDHTAKDGVKEAVQTNAVRTDVDVTKDLKSTPLVGTEHMNDLHNLLRHLPPYEETPVFDLHHKRRGMETLSSQGFAFTENVRWWGRHLAAGESRAAAATAGGAAAAAGGGAVGVGEDLGRRFEALAQFWSGVRTRDSSFSSASATQAGCLIDSAPYGIVRPLAMRRPPASSPSPSAAPASARGPQQQQQQQQNFLVYQPPGGLGEWFVALRNAVGIAKALGRTLVVPPLLWEGQLSRPIALSSLSDFESLRRAARGFVKLIESDAFSALGLAPSLLVMVHVKDPRVLPSRAYFDNFYRWHNVSAVHVPSQMAMGADYRRLYGACNHQVLALSSAYAAFEGFESGTDDAAWFEGVLPRAVWSDRPAVSAAVGKLVARLRRDTGKFSCLHLADLDAAVLTARGPEAGAAASSSTFSSAASSVAASSRLADMNDADGGRLLDVDIAAPAARSFGYGGPVGGGGGGASACDGYDAEAQTDSGRAWVRSAYDSGYSCHLDDATVVRNLPRLPPKDPVFLLADGLRTLAAPIAEGAGQALRSQFMRVGELAVDSLSAPLAAALSTAEWPMLEHAVCAHADTLMLSMYSPLSHALQRRSAELAKSRRAMSGQQQRKVLHWLRIASDMCLPIFTRTARFDISPNRFGILGQFGPERKLQLQTTNLTSMVAWDGRLIRNASLEMEIFVSNESHALDTFEYTKWNNKGGIALKVPPPKGGWRARTWHSIDIPLEDSHYSYPQSTPWGQMDRLELYYTLPHREQKKGDFVRIRNVFVRSTRSFRFSTAPLAGQKAHTHCRELRLVDKLRQLQQPRDLLGGARDLLGGLSPLGLGQREDHMARTMGAAIATALARHAPLEAVATPGGGDAGAAPLPAGRLPSAATVAAAGLDAADPAVPDVDGGSAWTRDRAGGGAAAAGGGSDGGAWEGSVFAIVCAAAALVLLLIYAATYSQGGGGGGGLGAPTPRLPFGGSRIE